MRYQTGASKIGLIVAAAIVVLGVGLAAYAINRGSGTDDDGHEKSATSSTTSSPSNTSKNAVVSSTIITLTDKGFDKSTYTSKAGEAVTVRNNSSNDMQFSSGEHPTHKEHPELNMGVMGPGETGMFTPGGKGTYNFHDHINPQFTGTLIVE